MLNDLIFFCAPARFVAVAVALWIPMAAFGQPVNDSLDRDYAKELPRIPPRSATEMLKTFSAVAGYRMELVASEPTVVDPIAIDFDARGRIYAVEMRGYSEDDEQNLGRIRLLEDRDGDGRYEASTVFADNLSWPTALLCYEGGVFVGVAPDIWFFRDNDGDGRADEKRIVFTGFARSNVQGLLNSFRWSIDNRVEAATSSSGAAANAPGNPDTPPLALRGRDFSFDPRTGELRAESGGAQHGICFDQWGNKFVCSNSSHLQQVMFEDRYVARNPYLAAPSPRLLIANDGGQAEVYRLSPVEPWRLVRTRLRVQKLVRGPVEGGGRAAGYFTSATGLTIYLGDAWKKQDHGMAIVGDVGSNIVHRKRLQRESDALQYVGRRIDQQSEFIASDNIWFRPVQFKNGPDGCLYVVDMAREVIEHPASLPPIIKKHLDLTSGRDRGRIYRIAPQAEVRSPTVALHRAAITDLVAMLEHPNGWHRTTAARLIYSQRKPQAVPALRSLVANSKRPEARILALYALRSLDALAQDTVVIAMDDDEPQVRRHAIRVSESLLNRAPELRAKLVSMTNDKDIRVRYQLAFTLGELQPTVKTTPLFQLIKQDGDQRWMAIAIQSALGKGAGLILEEVVRHQEFAQTKTAGAWLARLSAQIGKQQRPEDIAAVLKILGNPQVTKSVSSRLITGLGARPNSALAKQLAAVTGGSAAEVTRMLIQEAVKKLQNEKLEVSQRAAAVRSLTLGEFAALQSVFMDLLEPAQPVPLQEAALQTLARFTDDGVAELLLNRWATFSPKLRNRT
ncbi:MAG: PVC-type heme-binding CxxCH protein, partial [Pirellulaceae bacterium]